MTSRSGGGAKVPDGIPRPANIPFSQGPNRSDLSALPGTPGTALPGPDSSVPLGKAGEIRRALSDIPLDQFSTEGPGLGSPTERPNEPITSGSPQGAGVGPEGLIGGPNPLDNKQAARESAQFYPVLAKLASLPGATTQTKILAQRMRANLTLPPEKIPLTPLEARNQQDGIPRPPGTDR